MIHRNRTGNSCSCSKNCLSEKKFPTIILASPGIAAAAIFAFTLAWNEFLYACILTETANAQTMPTGLASFTQLDLYRWGELSAGGLLMAIPAVVLYFLGQRFVVAGPAGGAVKG